MRGHNASLTAKNVTLPADQSWVKILDDNSSRMYLCIQNDHDAHHITVGFSDNTTAPTQVLISKDLLKQVTLTLHLSLT